MDQSVCSSTFVFSFCGMETLREGASILTTLSFFCKFNKESNRVFPLTARFTLHSSFTFSDPFKALIREFDFGAKALNGLILDFGCSGSGSFSFSIGLLSVYVVRCFCSFFLLIWIYFYFVWRQPTFFLHGQVFNATALVYSHIFIFIFSHIHFHILAHSFSFIFASRLFIFMLSNPFHFIQQFHSRKCSTFRQIIFNKLHIQLTLCIIHTLIKHIKLSQNTM